MNILPFSIFLDEGLSEEIDLPSDSQNIEEMVEENEVDELDSRETKDESISDDEPTETNPREYLLAEQLLLLLLLQCIVGEDPFVDNVHIHYSFHVIFKVSTFQVVPSIFQHIQNITVAVRIIVGLALVIVAHQVLLKKPRTSELKNKLQWTFLVF